jgi:RNA polymerase sigma factor (sigma-70 family)
VFLQAAGQIGLDFLLYRGAELKDESRALELAEKAVHQASRARKSRPVEDPVAYLFRTFRRLVDRELERARRFHPLSDEAFLGRRESGTHEEELDRLILWREVLESVDEAMRWVLWRLRHGFSVGEIAEDLGVAPNTLSQRLSRVRRELKRKLGGKVPSGPGSEMDGTRNKSGTNLPRDLPDDGRGDARQLPKSRPRRLPK